MFGDLFGNFEQKQADMLAKTAAIVVETTVGGIKIAARRVPAAGSLLPIAAASANTRPCGPKPIFG